MIEEWIGEIVIGLFILMFGWSFSNWAKTVKESTANILDKLTDLAREFHEHAIQTENRVTRVEEHLRLLDKTKSNKPD